MTKKVLISWDDYIELQEEAMKYEDPTLRLMKFRELFLHFFDDQPDAPDPHEIREDDQEKYQEWLCAMLKSYGYEENAPELVPSIFHWISRGRPKAVISKMERTGGEDDN